MTKRTAGILCMLATSLCFAVMDALGKLASLRLPSTEIAFFRCAVTLLIFTPYMLTKKIPMLGKNRLLLFVRGTFGFTSLTLGFYAISHLPLADATILWKTSVIFTALFSAIFLQEKITASLVGFMLLALCGAALVLKPSFSVINLPGLSAICAGMALAVVAVSIRRLHQTEAVLTIVFSFSFWGTVLAFLLMFKDFVTPNNYELFALLGLGVVGTFGQLFYTHALRLAAASVVQPYAFAEVLISLLFGIIFWGELPDFFAAIGGTLIALAGIGILKMKES